MVKKVIILILSGFFVSIVQSCCIEEYNYEWNDFKIQVIDNSKKEPVIWDMNNIINKKALGFRISLEDTIFYIVQHFSIITKCYATSCGQKYNRLHSMTSINIKTIYNYSEDFPAGSDITSLFKARISNNTEEDYITIDVIISQINNARFSYYEKTERTEKFDLYLMDNTCTGGQQKFEINILFSDGTILIRQSDDIILE